MNQLRGSARLGCGQEIAKHWRRIRGVAPGFASRSLDHPLPRWRPAPCPRGRRSPGSPSTAFARRRAAGTGGSILRASIRPES